MKLNILLAKTDQLQKYFNAMIQDYGKFFSKSQGAFKGERKTYTPKEGTVVEEGKTKNVLIQTTVDEKFDYLIESSREYINALFSQEKTNSSGLAKAELIVEGTSWGEFSSLELLRLRSLVESGDFYTMLNSIPVRSDSEQWEENTAEMYEGRAVFQSPMLEGVEKTTVKTAYILEDPNVKNLKNTDGYKPVTSTLNEVMELGDYTYQKFSGEYSQRQKAAILTKRNNLLVSIVEALKKANEADIVASELTAEKIFGYLLNR